MFRSHSLLSQLHKRNLLAIGTCPIATRKSIQSRNLNTCTRGVVCRGRLGTARTECIDHTRRSLCIGGPRRVSSEPKKKGHHEKSSVISVIVWVVESRSIEKLHRQENTRLYGPVSINLDTT